MRPIVSAAIASAVTASILAGVSSVVAQSQLSSEAQLVQKLIDELDAFKGSVVAFDRKGGCPAGWSPHTDSYGRVIVGAIPNGPKRPSEMTHEVLDHKAYFAGLRDGEEHVALTPSQMPSHWHVNGEFQRLMRLGKIGEKFTTMGGDEGLGEPILHVSKPMLKKGGDEGGVTVPHNNMPPYIALYFCKKGDA